MAWVAPKVKGDPPVHRSAHTMALSGTKLVVFGGSHGGQARLNDVHALDTALMTWSRIQTKGVVPEGRAGHSCTSLTSTELLIFGGDTGAGQLNDVLIFDVTKSEWSRLTTKGSPPSVRNSHSAVLYGQNIFIFGGYGKGAMNDLTILDTKAKSWFSPETSGKAANPRCYHTANMYGSKMIVFGGFDGVRRFHDVYVLDTSTLITPSLSLFLTLFLTCRV
eukprot:TRINITY_DN483_c1_g1_i1.p1 TRINITY_DN483_c1_g1~~TRINITY_DN483_c1_g1_i1.p1  ORF type:complete len:220 (+),score=11.20 TRINITY_DN483_c1_g1_i1:262-921(+)